MTAIKKCLEHWLSVQEARKTDISNSIKELEKLEEIKPFNYSQWEVEMANLRRLRNWKECTDWFVTSLEYHDLKFSDNQNNESNDEALTFDKELESLINRYSIENKSNTQDFILAKFLTESLDSFNNAVMHREKLK